MPSRDAVFMSSIIFGVAATHRRHGSRARAGWKPSVRRCFLCFLTTFGVMLLMEMLLLPSGMLRGLPGSSAAPVSVNAIRRATQDALSALTSGGPNPRPAGLAALAALPNISVVMPCFGHVAFQEEAIASVVHQQYPPAEIIVVDDGSEDKCAPTLTVAVAVALTRPDPRPIPNPDPRPGRDPGRDPHQVRRAGAAHPVRHARGAAAAAGREARQVVGVGVGVGVGLGLGLGLEGKVKG